MKDIICPQCRTRHGPAATLCECGHEFEKEVEDPAPPRHFFIAALCFGIITVISSVIAHKNNAVYLPIGGLLFTSVAFTLGCRSWLYFKFQKKRK
jgi:hypothetical protein